MHGPSNCTEKGLYDANTFGNGIYLAPEVLSGKPFDKVKADVFSAAVILYRMIFSEHPFDMEKAVNSNQRYMLACDDPNAFWAGDKDEAAQDGEDDYGLSTPMLRDGYSDLKDLLGLMW